MAQKQKRVDEATRKATASPNDEELQDELKKAQDELQAAQDRDTVENLSAAADDFSDLEVMPDLCETPDICQFRK
ncbi:MAG TPA: hypothetical protein VGX03_39520 [Candidatus Binatia bacterium]|nr:hypothetical protein [Candidatus Binatia bacterium]